MTDAEIAATLACIVVMQAQIVLKVFEIDQVYRFEDDTDPDNQSILYAISSTMSDLKGTLVNGYGNSSDTFASKLIERLNTHND